MTVKSKTKMKFEPITVSEQNGIRYMHFNSQWVQGAMRISAPNQLILDYSHRMVAWMLFNDNPKTIGQLGLGSASLTKFCYHYFPESKNIAVEINPEVISICRQMFALPENDSRLQVLAMDANEFVMDKAHFNLFDILHVDLYDAQARGPVLDSPAFYGACKNCLTKNGIMVVNLFGLHESFKKNVTAVCQNFKHVICLSPVEAGNVALLAFNKKPEFDHELFQIKAKEIKKATKVPTSQWLKDLKKGLLVF